MTLRWPEAVVEWDPARPGPRRARSRGLPADDGRLVHLARAVADVVSPLGPLQALLVRRAIAEREDEVLEDREELFVRLETPQGALLESWGAPTARTEAPTEVAARLLARLTRAAASLQLGGGALPPDLPLALAPSVAAPLVAALALLLRGDVATSSGLSRNVGKRVFPTALTIRDQARHPSGTRARGVDDEGSACADVTLVADGALARFLHSRATAGDQSNGRGFAAGSADVSPGPLNLHVQAGTAPLPPDRASLDCRLETFTPSPRPGHVSLRVAGRVVRGGEQVGGIAPFDLELPVLATFRRLIATGGELTFFPAFDGVGAPWLLFGPAGTPGAART